MCSGAHKGCETLILKAGDASLITERTETRYQDDDTNTIGLVVSLFCGVGSIFACFAFVAICYR